MEPNGGCIGLSGITENLHNPEWWFTALFTAIIAGIIAGFLKDAISRSLAHGSKWYGSRRAKAIQAQEEYINALVNRVDLLILETVHTAMLMILFIACFGGFMLMPIWADMMNASEAFRGFARTGVSVGQSIIITKVMTAIFALLSLFCGFITSYGLSLLMRVHLRRRLKARGERSQISVDRDTKIS